MAAPRDSRFATECSRYDSSPVIPIICPRSAVSASLSLILLPLFVFVIMVASINKLSARVNGCSSPSNGGGLNHITRYCRRRTADLKCRLAVAQNDVGGGQPVKAPQVLRPGFIKNLHD